MTTNNNKSKRRKCNSLKIYNNCNPNKPSIETSCCSIGNCLRWKRKKSVNNKTHCQQQLELLSHHHSLVSWSCTFLFRWSWCYSMRTSPTSKPRSKKIRAEWWSQWQLQSYWSSSQWICSCLSSKRYCLKFVDCWKRENLMSEKTAENHCAKSPKLSAQKCSMLLY